MIDADTRLVVAVGRPLPGNRNDCTAWELSGAKDAVGKTTVCRLKGDCVHHAMLGIARLHNLTLAGQRRNKQVNEHVVDHLRDSPQTLFLLVAGPSAR